MNKKNIILQIVFPILFFMVLLGCQDKMQELGTEQLGEFAPPDAYEEGSKHPYYGSENEWNRRFFTEHITRFYKRRGQRQMLDIVEGRTDDAIDYCRSLLKDDPNDLESLYNLSVALTVKGQNAQALAAVKEALDKGLPFSRFLAGPRDLLKPLTTSKEFQELKKSYNLSLVHGPMLGDLTDNSVRIWLRTAEESEVYVMAGTTEDLSDAVQSNTTQSQKADDYTARVNLDGLKSSTNYYYNVFIDGQAAFDKELPSFKTYPGKVKAQFSIAFGGGAGYVPASERIWDVIKSRQPSAFLTMGDNVYMNMPENPNAFHQYTYYRRQSRPEFKRLISSIPIYAIWDDHDAGTDDCWLGPYKDKPTWKMPLLEFFKQNWNNPAYGDSAWPGCWFSFSIDDVDIFMLDGRFYRTNPFLENPTMLGPVQKAWLLDGLKKSAATFKVIASPVPWALSSKGEARDTWNGFKEERKEIFDFLAVNKIEGVILISADRHRSDAWKIERENGYPLYEFESSRLTNQHYHPLVEGALFGYNKKQSFGWLVFDTQADDPQVTFNIVNIDNELINSKVVKKSELSYGQ
jgi:alkaline phosphatase D